MNLEKILFRRIRETLSESLLTVVSFDDLYSFLDYLFDNFDAVPLLSFYGFDDRISWNTYIVVDNVTHIPMGYVHIPYDLAFILSSNN